MRTLLGAGLCLLLLTPTPAAASAADPLEAYRHQRLSWGACAGVDDPRLSCAAVRVPLDYQHPGGRAITVTISRLTAGDPARRRGVLLTTEGGPGGAGVPLPVQLSQSLDPAVPAGYDLIGFDVRFVHRSTPITCGQPAEEPGGFWVRTDGLQTFDRTAAEARALARDCQRFAGWALPHATTANAARDMDLIRAVLGEPRISYLGGSYAALLGVAYGTLFPGRIDRLVLDSPPSLDAVWREFELRRTGAMEENFTAFLDWVAADDATYHFGATQAAARATIIDAFARANTEPIVAGDHAWTAGELGYLFVLATLFDQLWPVVAVNAAAIFGGSPPPIPLTIRPSTPPGVPTDNHTAVNQAFRCGDHGWPRDLNVYRQDLAAFTPRFPVYGPANANVNPCAFWPFARDATPPLPANRAPAALVLAALHDAAVPLPNALATQAAIRGSRLVTVDRRVHVPLLSGQAGACMSAAVTGYLVTGRLPAADLAC
jgi:pimeloyl-ACP methyl ester carboxylesterase